MSEVLSFLVKNSDPVRTVRRDDSLIGIASKSCSSHKRRSEVISPLGVLGTLFAQKVASRQFSEQGANMAAGKSNV
jgi:hypothetical protein